MHVVYHSVAFYVQIMNKLIILGKSQNLGYFWPVSLGQTARIGSEMTRKLKIRGISAFCVSYDCILHLDNDGIVRLDNE